MITYLGGFSMGSMFAACMLSLHQDMLGKERYLALASEHWLPASTTVPIAFLGLGITVMATTIVIWDSLTNKNEDD